MDRTNNVFRRWSDDCVRGLGDIYAYRRPGWDVDAFIAIVTQVACETTWTIRRANAPTLEAALAYINKQGCVSEKTKRRQIESRLRRLRKGTKSLTIDGVPYR